MSRSFASVTELPGAGATREQLSMLYTRYRLAARHAAGKDVLEVACGPGIGLGYLARAARVVVGGDVDETMLRQARATYGPTMRLVRLDAHALPFAGRSFDLVLLYEALYYLSAPERFLREARRLLRPAGTLLISTVNRLWDGFNPSPYSVRYFSAQELQALLRREGFEAELYAAFPARAHGVREAMLASLRRAAVSLHLIPPSMKGKTVLKRLVYGPLAALPSEAQDGMAAEAPLVPVEAENGATGFKVLYAVAHPS
ncbi:MAG: class I SAM-dependent methyltransferase [Armatimonadota bacterium]|nr:class I SAM-dependent methyltransferase [Armatimonadota bacterium]